MSFDQKFFAPVAPNSTQAPALFSYASATDTLGDIIASDYFDDKKFQLRVGDWIYVDASDERNILIYRGEGTASQQLILTTGAGMPVAPTDQPYLAQGMNWLEFAPIFASNLPPVEGLGTNETNEDRYLVPDGANGLLWQDKPVYGTEYQYAESLIESSTTSTSFQEKLKLTSTTVPAGDYMVGWSGEVRNTSDERGVNWRVQLNDATDLAEGRFDNPEDLDDSYISFSGFAQVTLTEASHTIDIDWSRSSGGGNARIRNARLQLYRVA